MYNSYTYINNLDMLSFKKHSSAVYSYKERKRRYYGTTYDCLIKNLPVDLDERCQPQI